MLVDTHAHLYWENFQQDFDEVINRSLDVGVTTIINVGVDVNLSKRAAEQVKNELINYPKLKTYSTIGIHPHEATKYSSDKSIHEDITQLEKLYQSQPDQIVAVGECGLDYFLQEEYMKLPDGTPLSKNQVKALQRRLFQSQIELARKLNLPLIVHIRDDRSIDPNHIEAWSEIFDLIGNHPTILHCYSGLPETTKKAIDTPNVLISFAATVTYPKNEYLQEAARVLPLEKIVLETDSPFLSPQSKRGQRNEPASIREIAQLIAGLKSQSLEEIARQTTENVKIVFNL